LLRLWPGQHHTKVKCMQKPFFRNPATLFDQLAVHDRNLPSRATKADEAELQPEAEGFAKRDNHWLVGAQVNPAET
jgi:hypothetical protein